MRDERRKKEEDKHLHTHLKIKFIYYFGSRTTESSYRSILLIEFVVKLIEVQYPFKLIREMSFCWSSPHRTNK